MQRLTIARTASALPMGAQRYEDEVVARVPALLPGWDVRVSVARPMRSDLPGTLRLPVGWLREASPARRRLVGRALHRRDGVVHRMDLVLPPGPTIDVATLHDTVSWRFPDESPPIRASAEELRRAAAVVCVSQFTADEASATLGIKEPVVVHNGVDAAYFDASPLDAAQRVDLGLDRPYLLHAGGASERKNLEGLAAAWADAQDAVPDVVLALAGPPHPRRDKLFGRLPRTILLGRLPDPLMPGLVAAAEAVVVPSTYEGFGLPALEAMAAGTPVVVADRTALPEVVGGCGLVVEPTAEALAEAIVGVLRIRPGERADLVARARARAAEFTWERSARGHADVWRRVGG